MLLACPRVEAQTCPARRAVLTEDLVAAMEQVREETDYDVTATTNQPRFHGDVLLRLADDASPPRMLVTRQRWQLALAAVFGVDLAHLPLSEQLAGSVGHDWEIDRLTLSVPDEALPPSMLDVRMRWIGDADHVAPVQRIEARRINLQLEQRLIGLVLIDRTLSQNAREVPHPA